MGAQEAVAGLWSLAGGDPAALGQLALTGAEPALPSSFRLGSVAQAAIAASGLAAAELRHAAGFPRQPVAVAMRHAAVEFQSERHLRLDGAAPPPGDPLMGLYRARDGYVRVHTNFAHHRARILAFLGCAPTREALAAALAGRDAVAFETEAHAAGAVVAALRDAASWAAHPQAQALARLPVISVERIGEASPRKLPDGARPLGGVTVVDLTRVIAGPVAGRTLAAHGADVRLITAPALPQVDSLLPDTARGKRVVSADLATAQGRDRLAALIRGADIVIQGFRPGALDRRGFSPAAIARLRPGVVCVWLSSFGHVGPWAGRRGFDSLVQTATGFNAQEGRAAGTGPKELPCQALDHATGYLMAFAAMMARLRQAREGGSWLVRASLAQTGRWVWGFGRQDGFAAAPFSADDIETACESRVTTRGLVRAVRHAARLAETPACWEPADY